MPITCSYIVKYGDTGNALRCNTPVKWTVKDGHRVYERFCDEHKPVSIESESQIRCKSIRRATDGYPQLRGVLDVEDLLCLAALIAGGILPPTASLSDSRDYESLHSCDSCPMLPRCLGQIINE
jgi:hypothetical protein